MAVLLARTLGHPLLGVLEQFASEEFPGMAAMSDRQWAKIEFVRRRKTHEEQVQKLADYLLDKGLQTPVAAVVRFEVCRQIPSSQH